MRRISLPHLVCTLAALSQVALARPHNLDSELQRRQSELPACAVPCFNAATLPGVSGCPADDPPCICDSQSFYESMLSCVLTVCGFNDVSNILAFGLDFCNRTGVDSAERLAALDDPAVTDNSIRPQPTPEPSAPTKIVSSAEPTKPPTDPEETIVVIPEPSVTQFTINPTSGPSETIEPAPTTQTLSEETEEAGPETTGPVSENSITSAPPTPTADEPSSATASVVNIFGRNSFNSLALGLVVLFFVI